MNQEILLTTVQAAKYLGLSPRTLERWRLTGAGPRYRVLSRKAVRYLQSDLTVWLDAAVRSSTSDSGPGQPPPPLLRWPPKTGQMDMRVFCS